MRFTHLLITLFALFTARASVPTGPLDVLLVIGAPGEKDFAQAFSEQAQDWVNACRTAKKSFQLLEPAEGQTNQLDRLSAILTNQPSSDQEFWVVLIGHGTFDGKDAKFNLAGPDLSGEGCAELLKAVRRPVILINASSASAPFINRVSGPDRIVITATKSGFEENYARFGRFFAKAFSDLAADLDKDGQVSLLEAFLMASRNVEDFYKSERRLATEHSLLDDNGDGKGTPATFYRGVRPAKKPEEAASVDGFRAHQIHFLPNEAESRLSPALRKKRNELELQLEQLRGRKAVLNEDEYLKEVEPVLLEIARLYRDAAKPDTQPENPSNPSSK